MMNSMANDDGFDDNPFRSGTGGGSDVFFDAAPQQTPPQQQFQQQQQPQFQQQQQFQPQSDPFAPQPPVQNNFPQQPPVQSNFAPPSGPMDNMAPQQQPQLGMQPMPSRSWWGNCMACLTLEAYKAYFDIEAEDILARMKGVVLHFYKPEYFRNNVIGAGTANGLKGPDLYGPFWITMTLIFFIGVTSNMHAYLRKDDLDEFDYDMNHLIHAATVLCGFSFVLPTIFWITTQCMNMQALLLVEWVCLYGYSLTPFLPTVMLCVIPVAILQWVLIAVATVVSGLLIVRNVTAPMLSTDVGQAKAPPLILSIIGCHVIFLLYFKISFYHVKKH
mmetsp:Transcript_75923/g.114336  ORF Transcript_75923/g.114336 Transcript_75923/m.114336 type:complete len:331 (+) Transcript_75923:85-1077(+)